MAGVRVELKLGDILAEKADVLILKYAQALHGLDNAVVSALAATGRQTPLPEPWGFRLEDSIPSIAASRLLFVGVPPIYEFRYSEIRSFARKALAALAREAPHTRHVVLTIHGVGYGLDEVEAFESEIAGLVDAVRENECPEELEKITIVERSVRLAKRLEGNLVGLLPDHLITKSRLSAHPAGALANERLRTAGYASDSKTHVFVAMPFKEEMDDIYHYGIESAVKASGLLCERADLSSFTGDVLDWVRSRIRSASLVIADLTDANPNVYLEVGYAWGIGIPTVLVVNGADHLKFDVRGQRCLVYKKIQELEDSLTVELRCLRSIA